MIHVVGLLSRRGATKASKLAVNADEINERSASSQLNQADLVLPAFFMTAEYVAIETLHGFDVDGAKDDVVDFTDANHGGMLQCERMGET